jgi:hemoglobin
MTGVGTTPVCRLSLGRLTRASLYEFAGGHDAFLALAAAVTERCIADPELNHAFSQRLSRNHDENLAAYWEEVFGGPTAYSRNLGGHSGMLSLHADKGAPEDWGDRFERCFLQGLDDAELPRDPEFRRAMGDYIHWATRQVNHYSPVGSRVEPDLPMPHWSWEGLEQAEKPAR